MNGRHVVKSESSFFKEGHFPFDSGVDHSWDVADCVAGKMYPGQGDLHIAPFTDEALYMEQYSKANFW